MTRFVSAAGWILAILLCADAWAQVESVQLRGRRWRPAIDGDIQTDENGAAGTNLDLRGLLDLTEDPDINDFGAVFTFPGTGKLNLQWWEGAFESEGVVLPQDVTYGSATFSSGSSLDTRLDWKVGTLMLEYEPSMVPLYGIPAVFAFNVGTKYITLDGELEAGSTKEGAKMKGYLPVVGLHGRLQPTSFFTVEIDANGLLVEGLELYGLKGTVTDIAVTAQVAMSGLTAGIGYRWFKLKAEDERSDVDKYEADLVIKGLFAEVGLKW